MLLLAKKISGILLEFPYLVPAKINHYQINFHQINSSNKFLSKKALFVNQRRAANSSNKNFINSPNKILFVRFYHVTYTFSENLRTATA